MSFRHLLQGTEPSISPGTVNSGKDLAVIPKWFVIETMLATIAIGT